MSNGMRFLHPPTISEALAASQMEDSQYLAGGTSSVLLLKHRLIDPKALIWIADIPELREIRRSAQSIEIGAMTTLADLGKVGILGPEHASALQAAQAVGNVRVRAAATIGGAIAHGDPRQDLPPALIALGALVNIVGPEGERTVGIDGFYRGFLEVDLHPGELIRSISVPVNPQMVSQYHRFTPRSPSDYPTVGVAVSAQRSLGREDIVRVVIAGVGEVPFLLEETTGLGPGPWETQRIKELASRAAAEVRPSDDERGSSSYKRAMTALWTERALLSVSKSLGVEWP